MGIFRKNRAGFALTLTLATVLLLPMLAIVLCGCGDGGESTTSSTADAISNEADQVVSTTVGSVTESASSLHERVQQEQAGSTSVPAGSSTTIAAQTTSTISGGSTTTSQSPGTTGNPTSTTAKSSTTTAKATTTTAKPTTTTAKGPVVLTVVGPSGSKELSMADLKAMGATSGYGGWKNQLANITAPVAWKGVSVKALLELVGGGGSALVTASDEYQAVLSGSELNGECNMYDPTTGASISSISGSISVIVAYAKNGSALSSSEGPLRIAFVSPAKDQVTDSDKWVRQVVGVKAQ